MVLWKPSVFRWVRWLDVGCLADCPHMGTVADLVLDRVGRNEQFHFVCMYGPHDTEQSLACLRACQTYLSGLEDPWVWLGDFNLVVRPDEARPRRVLHADDVYFAFMVGEGPPATDAPDGVLRPTSLTKSLHQIGLLPRRRELEVLEQALEFGALGQCGLGGNMLGGGGVRCGLWSM